MTLLGFIATEKSVWVGSFDAAELLKMGMRMTSSATLLDNGPFGEIAGTRVYIDRSLPRGTVRTLDGTLRVFGA